MSDLVNQPFSSIASSHSAILWLSVSAIHEDKMMPTEKVAMHALVVHFDLQASNTSKIKIMIDGYCVISNFWFSVVL